MTEQIQQKGEEDARFALRSNMLHQIIHCFVRAYIAPIQPEQPAVEPSGIKDMVLALLPRDMLLEGFLGNFKRGFPAKGVKRLSPVKSQLSFLPELYI